jgi:hypothetical protein
VVLIDVSHESGPGALGSSLDGNARRRQLKIASSATKKQPNCNAPRNVAAVSHCLESPPDYAYIRKFHTPEADTNTSLCLSIREAARFQQVHITTADVWSYFHLSSNHLRYAFFLPYNVRSTTNPHLGSFASLKSRTHSGLSASCAASCSRFRSSYTNCLLSFFVVPKSCARVHATWTESASSLQANRSPIRRASVSSSYRVRDQAQSFGKPTRGSRSSS